MGFLDNTGLAHLWEKITTALSGKLDTTGNAYRTASIPFAQVDDTSTSTAFTATVPGITELRSGVCVFLMNGVVTSASGFTININGLGAKPVYSTLSAASRATTLFNVAYTLFLVYNEERVSGGCWDAYYGYDSNTNSIGYQLRTNSTTMPTLDKFYRYRLLFTSADRKHFVPANTSSSTSADTAKTTTQRPIDPFGAIYYYGYTTAVNANANPTATYFWTQYNIALGYSFNRTGAALTLTSHAPVYIKCAPQSDGSAIIDADNPFVQTLPSTTDGKIYIFLGVASSATAVELVSEHPVFCYRNEQIRLWTGNEETELPDFTANDEGKVLGIVDGAWGLKDDESGIFIDGIGEEDEQGNLLQFSIADSTDTINMLSEAGVYRRVETDMNAYRAASIPMGHLNATSTATAMTAWVIGITELRDGVCMWLRNGVITSASGFTLNVNNLGAKPCYSSLAAATRATTEFNVNYTMLFVYNETRVSGGCWDIVYGYDTNTTYTPSKLGFGYGTCTTAAATAAKTASIPSYELIAGGIVSIHFDNDVPSGATLSINSKSAKAIYYHGAVITAGVIKAGDTATFIYSTYYHLISIDRDEAPIQTVKVNGTALVPDADKAVDVSCVTDINGLDGSVDLSNTYVSIATFDDITGRSEIIMSISNGNLVIDGNGTSLNFFIDTVLNNCNIWFLLPSTYITGIPSNTDMIRFQMTGANMDMNAPTVSLSTVYNGKVYSATLSPVSTTRMEGQLNVYNIALPSAESNSFGGSS